MLPESAQTLLRIQQLIDPRIKHLYYYYNQEINHFEPVYAITSQH
jgi:hypothetical protein